MKQQDIYKQESLREIATELNQITNSNSHRACSYGKSLSHLGGIPAKSRNGDPTKVGWLTSHMSTLYFYKSFLRKVRPHLGKPDRPPRPAHRHMNSP